MKLTFGYQCEQSRPQGYKTQLSMKFQMLLKTKMRKVKIFLALSL